jgi:peptide/nickel transport system permease protein
MLRYTIQRLLLAIPTLFGMSLLIFFLVRLIPGDVVSALMGASSSNLDPTAVHQLRVSLGLTQPLPLQYWTFISGFATGHLGNSLVTGISVTHTLGAAFSITFEIAILAAVIAILIGIPSGILSATRPNGLVDLVARLTALVGLSIPNFWFATLALLVLSNVFNWTPNVIWIPFFSNPLSNLTQVALPALAVSFYMMATVSRMTRSSLLEVLGQDYVRTAIAKGAPPRYTVARHALRNALIPILTVTGFQIGFLLGGTTVIEVVFGLPGIGYTLITAIHNRDYPIIQDTAMLLAGVFVLLNLLVDVLYGVVDPRMRLR